MAASAHLLLSALSKHPDAPKDGNKDAPQGAPKLAVVPAQASAPDDRCPFVPDEGTSTAEGAWTEPPLTSEPPLADAAPLTSEPPLADVLPLTSEPTPLATAAGQDPSVA
ncbi:hypothetical protein ACFVT5_05220 [Streptomyces sp. NPDC058001]|uniref:hypothetical protein n=1 Tax=Streptomyces sp. NPDC058001 TaxID=3346300 RepID=UPI0036E8CF8D